MKGNRIWDNIFCAVTDHDEDDICGAMEVGFGSRLLGKAATVRTVDLYAIGRTV